MHDTIHHTHADGIHYEEIDCPIYAAFRDGVTHQVEDDVFWRRDGSAIRVEYTSTPIRDGNRLVGAVIVFRDITARKEAEERLRAALEEVEQLRHRLELENAYLQEEIMTERNHMGIIGKSAAIQHLRRQIELVAPTDATVLISGESGTGKELIARALHLASRRSDRPIIRVNCAAVPPDLFESEFFGHARGAFTGALRDRVGRFELADGGTLFLDEVGEIPLNLQGKLLRVLQEGHFERVGEERTRKVDVRVIAATNVDLKRQIERGRFREDLYYRLNVFPIVSVPLRERADDIPLLAAHVVESCARRLNLPDLKLRQGDVERLTRYGWPGNVRELQNVIERAAILSKKGRLHFDLPDARARVGAPAQSQPPPLPDGAPILTEAARRERDRSSILAALDACNGRVFGTTGAAALLGVKPTTLASRIKALGIAKRMAS
jgi:transcriptional regulator with GAF, ATPase, and Fis domain